MHALANCEMVTRCASCELCFGGAATQVDTQGTSEWNEVSSPFVAFYDFRRAHLSLLRVLSEFAASPALAQ